MGGEWAGNKRRARRARRFLCRIDATSPGRCEVEAGVMVSRWWSTPGRCRVEVRSRTGRDRIHAALRGWSRWVVRHAGLAETAGRAHGLRRRLSGHSLTLHPRRASGWRPLGVESGTSRLAAAAAMSAASRSMTESARREAGTREPAPRRSAPRGVASFAASGSEGALHCLRLLAPVAQWIEHPPSKGGQRFVAVAQSIVNALRRRDFRSVAL